MANRKSSTRLNHREPVPRGLAPKIRHYGKWAPRINVPIIVLLMVAALAFPVWQFCKQSTYFHVNHWNIQGLERLTESEIKWLVGAQNDVPINLIEYDAKEAEKLILTHPGIYYCQVDKSFPETLDIVIFEREPEAILITEKGMLLVDAEGIAFSQARSEDVMTTNLPILTLGKGEDVKLGEGIDHYFRDQAFLYFETLQKTGNPLLFEVSEFHHEHARGLTLILRDGTQLFCGLLPPSQTIPKYEGLLQEIGEDTTVRYVDLRIDSHVPYLPGNPRAILVMETSN